MAVDNIDMCMKCAVAVEGLRMICPRCGGKLKRVDSMAFQAMVILRRKGYSPVEVKSRGIGKEKVVVVRFEGFSPGRGVHNEMKCTMEDGLAVCSTLSWNQRANRYETLLDWAREACNLERRVPYNRELCERCCEQPDEKWMHGICSCPAKGMIGSSKPGPFGDIEMRKLFPKKCLYLVEQTVTQEELEKDFLEKFVYYPESAEYNDVMEVKL